MGFARAVCLSLGLLLVGSGCSSLRVMSDYDRDVDFARYRTYRWAPLRRGDGDRVKPSHTLLDKRIRQATNRELSAKGLTLREDGPADLLIVYYVSSREKLDVYPAYGYWRPWGRRVHVHSYREGTLILDLVDPALDQMVWRGWATSVVGHPEEAEGRINEAVAGILERYPPGE